MKLTSQNKSCVLNLLSHIINKYYIIKIREIQFIISFNILSRCSSSCLKDYC